MSELGDRIARIYEAELAAGRQARTLEDVPGTYEAITAEWLTAVLCRESPGAEVASFRVTDRSDGSSNRARIHLEYNDAGRQAALPATVFCKGSVTLQNRVLLGASGGGKFEYDFFSKVRSRVDIETPVPIHACFDPETYAYLIVMKDIGGQAEFCTFQSKIDRAQAERQVETLARLHARFYQSGELGTPALPFKDWSTWWPDNLNNLSGFAEFCDVGFEAAQSVIPPSLYRRRAEIWPATEKSALRHRELPHTLIHSDVHLGNWYEAANGNMGLTDWQVVTIGHWSRDFVYTMVTSLNVEDRRNWLEELLRLYLARMAELGVPAVSIDEAWLNLRQQLMTALAFWTITLRPAKGMPDMQPESASYEFVRRLTAAIDDYDSLDASN